MTVAAVALRKTADERAELRRAVAGCASARAAIDRQREAIERAREHVAEAAGDHAAAVTALNAAQRDHAERIATAITGGASPTATGLIRAARAHERDAEDELAAARAALTKLEADLADFEAGTAAAGKAVDAALAEMMEPIAWRLVEEVRERRRRFLALQAALCSLGSLFVSWSELRKQIDRTAMFGDADDVRVSRAAAKEWQAALAALRLDADAEVPAIGEMTASSRVA
jgi:hypothetical protein